MNIAEIRLINLTRIIDEVFDKQKAPLARKIGVSPNNISRYYSKKEGDRRNISDATAKLIEDVAGKPEGWLSQMHNMPTHFEQMQQIMLMLTEEQQLKLVNEAAMLALKSKSQPLK